MKIELAESKKIAISSVGIRRLQSFFAMSEDDRPTKFVDLISIIDAEYVPLALKMLRCKGWDDAIAFCQSKLQPSVMQAQRDFEQSDPAD
jgi:hypothetical protein